MNKIKDNFVTRYKNKYTSGKFCRICGANANSFNYNGLACESCKTFFRRYSFRQNELKCHNEGKCEITPSNRKYCKSCRIVQCFKIGMKKELIWKSIYSPKSMKFSGIIKKIYSSEQEKRNLNLSHKELEYLEEISYAVANFPEERSLEITRTVESVEEFVTYPKLYIKKYIKYCKCLSSFKSLHEDDQLALIKSSYVQALSIRFAFNYNAETNQFPAIANEEGTKAILMDDTLFFEHKNVDKNAPVRFIKFRESLNFLMENNAIVRNLISIQLLFDNRNPNLRNPEFIRHQYYFYCTLLLRYYQHKHQCMMLAEQKYYTLMQALEAIDYQVQQIRKMFAKDSNLTESDLVHKEIFDL